MAESKVEVQETESGNIKEILDDTAVLEASEEKEEKVEEGDKIEEIEETEETEEKVEELKEDSPKEEVDLTTEVKELRQILREQKREIAELRGRQTEEVDEDGNRIPSRVEVLKGELQSIYTGREGQLDLMADTMREMDKYSDLDAVCSRTNFDDIIEMIATEVATKDGTNVNETILEVEKSIWELPNPYKYMYGLIKEYHPVFANKDKVKEVKKEVRKPEVIKDVLKSIQDVPGDSDTKSGWTAAKIDATPEEELNQVPSAIYQKYLKGELK